ncbi:glycosyltransferase family 4 protein [Geminocystis sp. NIES-3709]|uniref:glycosyltransferase family 4 protein n=1 Tax=Geminocystis sp. NIES-3709 TaxID=1617448 RepID=UPI0005FC8CEF|nr:glycosyltransferase family 4 protein [Geminocystis sp. NIES-3709]BAQ64656.1 glycosyl transferase in large core OS assembly cluster [Geminocystis sp. NIES-3709]
MNTQSFNIASQKFRLGEVWQIKGKIDRAIASYQEALNLQPDYFPAHLKIADLMLQQGNKEKAIDHYRQVSLLDQEKKTYSHRILAKLTKNEVKNPKKTFKIMVYTDNPLVYGAEQVNHSLLCGLQKAGYKVICVTHKSDTYLVQKRKKLGIEHIFLEPDNIYSYNVGLSRVPSAIREPSEPVEIFARNQPDLIIFGNSCPISCLAAREIAMQLEIPYIIIENCADPDWVEQFTPLLDRLPSIYTASQATIAVSEDNLNLLYQLFKLPSKIGTVIYNGRGEQFFLPPNPENRSRIRQDLGIPQDVIVCCTTARLDPVKGYHYQLSAIQQLKNKKIWSKLYFIWAGSGQWEKQLKETAEKLGVSEQVKFLGVREDIPNLLDASDIFILPSEVEGMPLAVMEAMAKGLPVIATAISGTPEELGDTGKLITSPKIDSQKTIQELVETIELWANNSTLRQEIGFACKQRAEKLFQEKQMLEKYLTLVEKILFKEK